MSTTNSNDNNPGGTPPPTSGLTPRLIIYTARRHMLALLGMAIVAAGLGAGIWFYLPLPKWTASVLFHLSGQAPVLLSQTQETSIDFVSFRANTATLLKNRRTLGAMMKQREVSEIPMLNRSDAVEYLENNLAIDFGRGHEYMRVSIEGDDPDQLKAILDVLQKTYLAAVDAQDKGARRQRLAQLKAKYDEYQVELQRSQKRIDDIALALGSKDGPTLAVIDSIMQEDFRQSVRECSTAQDQVRQVESDLAFATSLRTPKLGPDGKPVPVAVPLAMVEEELRREPAKLELDRLVARAKQILTDTEAAYAPGEKAPPIDRARENIKTAEEKLSKYLLVHRPEIEAAIREKYSNLERDHFASLQEAIVQSKRKADLAKEKTETINKRIIKNNEFKIELENIKLQISQTEKAGSKLADEIEHVKIELGVPSRVTLSEEPITARGVEGNRRMKYTLIGGVGLFMIGFGILVALEFRGRRVTHTTDVTSSLGLRLIGTVPPLPIEEINDESKPFNQHGLVEALDTIQAMLIHGGTAHAAPRTLLVTSAVAKEGKTTLSGHLAISFARAGFRTLLVDGDLRSPTVNTLFGIAESPGLSEVLQDESTPSKAIRPTVIPSLSVLPAGAWSSATRQALAAYRWSEVKRELESRFDYVIVDTGPVLFVSDTLQMARSADAVILSVLVGISQVGNVSETASRLRTVGAKLTGVVVSGVPNVGHGYGYGYKYAYQYGREKRPIPVAATEELLTAEEYSEAGKSEA